MLGKQERAGRREHALEIKNSVRLSILIYRLLILLVNIINIRLPFITPVQAKEIKYLAKVDWNC